jgi:DNA-cytosine methyltransferase
VKYIELFAGVGGMGHGLMRAGMECVGYVEIDKYAHKAFQLLHDPQERMFNAYDVRSVTDDDLRLLERERGRIDLIAGGFPCQSFSIAGKREGFADSTRGTLFFEIIRFASILRPQYLLLENVMGLLNHDEGRTFETIIATLDELGYDSEWQVLNSKNFGVPQNRERVFIIGHLRGKSRRQVFPIRSNDRKYSEMEKSTESIIKCLTARGIGELHSGMQLIKIKNRYRVPTPLEAFRLQSFPDEWYHTLKQHGISDSQLYKMAGNAVTSNVAFEIGKRIMEGDNQHERG